ncbi:MAG TPA: hypothetical protein VG755_40180 [Nannocystaceae bacterium]|nr:hypothetical protein [Nannocystaceae bacterium]
MTAACADEEECEQPLRLCEIDDAACQRHVFVQTACAREFAGRDVPSVRAITRDEFADELRGDGAPPTAAEQRADQQYATALRMLALLPPGTSSSDDAAIGAYAQSVLAYYSREDEGVTIISTNLSGADREHQVYVLSHEFVHAQQDVDVGLAQLFDAHVTSTDSNIALRSLTEGEAVLFSNLTLARQKGHRLSQGALHDYFDAGQQSLREDAADPEVGFTDITLGFPYPFGGDFVARAWEDGGPAAVLARYDDPPASTAEILRELGNYPQAHDVVVPPLDVDPVPEGWSIVDEDTLGAWVVHAVALRNGASDSQYEDEWFGDHFIVMGGPTAADVVLLWRITFATLATANQFANIGDATPSEGVRAVEVDNGQVTIVMAPDAATLADWQARIVGAEVDDAPPESTAPAHPRRRRMLGERLPTSRASPPPSRTQPR